MRLFLDCEFNGFRGELISMALVSEEDHVFYRVVAPTAPIDPWVAENVMPHLGDPPVLWPEFRRDLIGFLEACKGIDDELTIVADWPADVFYLTSVLMGDDHTETVNIEMEIWMIDIEGDLGSVMPHNALADARAIKAWAENNL